jgi:membrane protein required for colicin V production
MTGIDWILLGVLGFSALVGLWRGLMFEVLSLLGWIAAFFLAQWLGPTVGGHLPLQGLSDPVRYAAAFALTFVVAVVLAGLLAALVRKLVSAVGLRPVDRVLGAAFGGLRGVVVLLAVAVVVDLTPLKRSEAWQQSAGAPWLALALAGLKPVLPESLGRFLN